LRWRDHSIPDQPQNEYACFAGTQSATKSPHPMKPLYSKSALFLFSLLTFTLAGRASPIDAITISGGPLIAQGGITAGFQFTLFQAANVVSLGVFDAGSDGLAEAHDVGLWSSTGSLLASSTIAAGTGAILDNGFRYNDITPLTLTAGTYRIGAYFATSADPFSYYDTVTYAVPVTYQTGSVDYGSSLQDPSTLVGLGGFFGANFRIESPDSSVPDGGATATLLGGALLGFVALRRRLARA